MKSVDPDTATQDTTLDVTVSGSGFSSGSRVDLGHAGAPSGQVRTNSTTFVNSRKLIANVTISATADTGQYDVIVTALDGRKGIGIEMFTVKGKADAIPANAVFRDAATDGLLSDGLGTYSGYIRTNGNFFVDVRGTARAICHDFHGQSGAPPSACYVGKGYITSSDADTPGGLLAMSVGASMTISSSRIWVVDGYNWFLRYGRDCDLNTVPATRVMVSRLDPATWTVEYPEPALLCRMPTKGRPVSELVGTFVMPASITLQLQ